MLSWMCMLFGTGFLAQKLRGCGLLSTPIFFLWGCPEPYIYTVYGCIFCDPCQKYCTYTAYIYLYFNIKFSNPTFLALQAFFALDSDNFKQSACSLFPLLQTLLAQMSDKPLPSRIMLHSYGGSPDNVAQVRLLLRMNDGCVLLCFPMEAGRCTGKGKK